MNSILVKSILSNWGIVVFNVLFPLLTLPIITHSLGVDGYGQYVKVLSLGALYTVFTEMGLDMALTRVIANNQCSSAYHKGVVNSFFRLRVLFVICLLFPLLLASYFLLSFTLLEVIALGGIGSFSSLAIGFYFHGMEKSSQLFLMGLLCKIIILACYGVGWFLQINIVGFLFITVINFLLMALVPAVIFYFRVKDVDATYVPVKEIVREGGTFFGSRIIVNASLTGSPFLLSFFISDVSLGIYALVLQIYRIGSSFIGSLARALMASVKFSASAKKIGQVTIFFTLLALVLMAPITVLGEYLIPRVFGEGFNSAIDLVRWFYIGLVFQVSGAILGYPYLNAIGKVHWAHYSIFFGSLINPILLCAVIYINPNDLVYYILPIIITDILVAFVRVFLFARVSCAKVRAV